jgi:hypothetical protein
VDEKFLLFENWGDVKSITGKRKQDTRFHNENGLGTIEGHY